MLALPVHPVIELSFDPIATIGDWHVRLGTIALAVVILLALLIAARIARRTPVDLAHTADERNPDGHPNHLRRDDLLYVAVAAMPGAVVGGRLGYALVHSDYYGANLPAIIDIGQGGFQLSMAVLGGILTAAIVATLLDAPIRRWLHALILPLLFAIAGGKVAMALGGDGQGMPWDGPWATAYLGPGPWLSLGPQIPSHPSQLYEAAATAVVILVVGLLVAGDRFRRRGAGAFLLGLGLWAVARLLVAFTWRDPVTLGPFSTDQLLSLAIALVSFVLLAVGVARTGDAPPDPDPFAPWAGHEVRAVDTSGWPDPATRPRI